MSFLPLPDGFDPSVTLQSPALQLRPLVSADHEALAAAASDPLIWADHPAKTRHQPEVFARYFASLLATPGSLVARLPQTGAVIGTSRFYATEDTQPGLCIGFTFLTRAHWGGAMNFEMKRLMLDHIFAFAPEAWFHIDPKNIRSQKATGKLGAEQMENQMVDVGEGPADTCRFRLTEDQWRRTLARRGTRA